MNLVILQGRVGKTPEIRQVGTTQVGQFSLATTNKYKNKEGETVEETQWHNIEVWGNQTKVLAYVKQGDKLLVQGELKYENYEKDGVKRTATKIRIERIELLESKTSSNNTTAVNSMPAPSQEANIEGDLPF